LAELTRERVERIARSHACDHCQEYNYRKVRVNVATEAHRTEFGETWHVTLVCGVCGHEMEMGIDESGDILYVG
jgi:RNase P subunit RPR2